MGKNKMQSTEIGFECASRGGEVGRQVRVLNRSGCLREKVRSERRTAGARQLAKQIIWKEIIPGRGAGGAKT